MANTPLIKKISNKNGIFYAFQSGVRDSDMCNSSNAYRFAFSKYALLNIPDIVNGTSYNEKNTYEAIKEQIRVASENGEPFDYKNIPNSIQFNALGDSVLGYNESESTDKTALSKYLAESFQNYCLNLEAILLSQDGYDTKYTKRTVAERVFFKWLKELGAIRYEKAESNKYSYADTDKARFIEEANDVDHTSYSRVVQYINDIQAVYPNINETVSTELYIYVPTEQGASPYVLFESISDENYHYYTTEERNKYNEYTDPYLRSNSDPCLCGRNNTEHPTGLTAVPYYDIDSKFHRNRSNTDTFDNVVNIEVMWPEDSEQWYGDVNTSNDSYVTDSGNYSASVGDNGNYFGDSETPVQVYSKSFANSDKKLVYVRPYLDGVTIDFNTLDYNILVKDINDNTEEGKKLKNTLTLNDLNSTTNGGGDFKFNAVLIYYDMINPVDGSSVTNLYGVYFLNEIDNFADKNSYIVRDIKYAPNATNENASTNGNALAYKINFKSDTSFENADVTPSINTRVGVAGNTFSMDLFIDAMTSMKTMTDAYEKNLNIIKDYTKEIEDLRDMITNTENTKELEERIEKLEAYKPVDNLDYFTNLLEKVYDDYNSILQQIIDQNKISVDYKVNDTYINSIVKHKQEYTDTVILDLSADEETDIPLKKYTNYIRHYYSDDASSDSSSEVALMFNKTIVIDCSENMWETGQTVRIVFGSPLDPRGFLFTVKTVGKKNDAVVVDKEICRLSRASFRGSSNKPIFEIICTSAENMTFVVDQIR